MQCKCHVSYLHTKQSIKPHRFPINDVVPVRSRLSNIDIAPYAIHHDAMKCNAKTDCTKRVYTTYTRKGSPFLTT